MIVDFIKFLIIVTFDVHRESSDKVDDVFLIFNWVDPPVVNHEFQLLGALCAFSYVVVSLKGVVHDGN